jgi:protein phosphatase 1L
VFRRRVKEKSNVAVVRYGVADTIGSREQMEDAHAIWSEQEMGFLGAEVYDGHAGSLAAQIAARKLVSYFVGAETGTTLGGGPPSLTAEALREAYLAVDREIVASGTESGAAAATFYVQGQRFLAANVGDSRIVVAEGGNAVELTLDHRPDLPEERARIEALGGKVISLDMARVQGMLAMSRALGDAPLKPFVTPEPRIAEGSLGRSDELAVIACDGLWDVLTSEEAITMALTAAAPDEAARLLREAALERGSTDNITVVVLDLKPYAAGCTSYGLRVHRVLDRAVE